MDGRPRKVGCHIFFHHHSLSTVEKIRDELSETQQASYGSRTNVLPAGQPTMKTQTLFSLVLLVISTPVLAEIQADIHNATITGFAYARGSDTLLYTENHRVQLRGKEIIDHKTDYKDAAGKVIATKWMDYTGHPFAPSFQLDDLRDGYIEGAKHLPKGYAMYSREKTDKKMEEGTAKVTNKFVADSGFDLYVRARMPQLLEGKTQQFDMAVPSVQKVLSFEAVVLKQQTRLFERPAIYIKVQPATLLRLLVDPIYLTYDTETGELLRYEGLTNIRDKTGNRHDARIDFPPAQQQYAKIR